MRVDGGACRSISDTIRCFIRTASSTDSCTKCASWTVSAIVLQKMTARQPSGSVASSRLSSLCQAASRNFSHLPSRGNAISQVTRSCRRHRQVPRYGCPGPSLETVNHLRFVVRSREIDVVSQTR
eukprot:6205133-Pleurochrysis_carterae.AAC.2